MSREFVFADMPPFEMVKVVLARTVQRRGRRKVVRALIFMDVSKAHLPAPVGEEIKVYVDFPLECSKGWFGELGAGAGEGDQHGPKCMKRRSGVVFHLRLVSLAES